MEIIRKQTEEKGANEKLMDVERNRLKGDHVANEIKREKVTEDGKRRHGYELEVVDNADLTERMTDEKRRHRDHEERRRNSERIRLEHERQRLEERNKMEEVRRAEEEKQRLEQEKRLEEVRKLEEERKRRLEERRKHEELRLRMEEERQKQLKEREEIERKRKEEIERRRIERERLVLDKRKEEPTNNVFHSFDESDFSISINNELSHRDQLERELREKNRILRDERLKRQRERYNQFRGPSHGRDHLDEEDDRESVHRTRPGGSGSSSVSLVHLVGAARGDRPSVERPAGDVTLNTVRTTETPPINIIPPPNYATGPMLHMLALDRPLAGSMRGLRGADYECHRQARRNRLPGTYRAFLSSETQNLNSIIYYSRDKQIPVVNAKGQILFNSWSSLTDGSGAYFNNETPIFSFDGKDVMSDGQWPQKIIWHGSNNKGEFVDDRFCNKWHSGSTDSMGRASSLMKHMLLDEEEYTCNNAFIVLCVENTARHN